MDDCRNCQTSTATPAEPGDLSWRLERAQTVIVGIAHVGRAAQEIAETIGVTLRRPVLAGVREGNDDP
jgi:hypothetical protein